MAASTEVARIQDSHESEIVRLPIGLLVFDPSYNRLPNAARIKRIAEEFNPQFMGLVTVSKRSDEEYAVVDGQHRVSAIRRLGWEDYQIESRCYYGLSIRDEARLHGGLNNLARPTALDSFRSREVAGEPIAVAIGEIVREFGLNISTSGGRALAGVSAAERVYTGKIVRANGAYPGELRATLRTLTTAFGVDSTSVNSTLIEGLALVYFRYGDAVDEKQLTRKLTGYPGGALALLGQAQVWRNMRGGSVPDCVAEVVVGLYNKNRRSSALPDWRATR